ncbi:HAD family hydrolase [Vreelandella populi]|uniref:HAD family hydrolase n=1 Tax=Vreelandella populi TaxID=2498858 RepID=UPI000F8EA53D|nr:hypothetical protein [Halomonas populi]RUR51647.1 hypothetical protein ELY40_17825 [Halomonas populi]
MTTRTNITATSKHVPGLKVHALGSRVASYGIFDTLVTRLVGTPSAVFLLLGRRLCASGLIECTPAAFAEHRREAERQARQIAHPYDVTLETIYRELSDSLKMSERDAQALAEAERALETELIRANPEMRDHINNARTHGDRIVFLSDMYLSSEFLEARLTDLGLFQKGDSCYVSCETKKSKRYGDSFRDMAEREAVSLGMISHIGDNYGADILAARKAGVRTEYFEHAHLNRYEKILETYSVATDGLTSVMAGASRMARLSVDAPSQVQAALRDVSAGVIAPVLAGYVLWILRRAKYLGLRRLYFVSRDGQILLDIAQRMSQKIAGFDIELRYFYGSRQALRIAELRTIDDEALTWILRRTGERSVRSYLARVNLTPEDIRASLLEAGLSERDWSTPLSEKSRKALGDVLVCGTPAEMILQRASDARDLLIRYAQQEGMLDAGEWGLVDTCGRGQMLNSLSQVVVKAGAVAPTAFYFQLMQGGEQTESYCQREAYFCDESRQSGYIKVIPDLTHLIELACSGDHGLVQGYSEMEGQIVPVLKAEQNTAVIDAGLPLLRQSCATFVDSLFLDPKAVDLGADTRAASAELIKKFWYTPGRWEARAWGAMPVETDHAGLTVRPLASPLTARDVCLAIFRLRRPPKALLWPQGCFAASSGLGSYKFIMRIVDWLNRKPKAMFRRWSSLSKMSTTKSHSGSVNQLE